MSVTSLELKNFSIFTQLNLDFCAGINTIIGENGTGKTHLLKLIYALHRSIEEPGLPEIKSYLHDAFRPDAISNLIHETNERSSPASRSARVRMCATTGELDISIWPDEVAHVEKAPPTPKSRAFFLPSRELLSTFDLFNGAPRATQRWIDSTHLDAFSALKHPLRRRPPRELLKPLVSALDVLVTVQNDRIFIREPGHRLREAHLVAEGHRKLATLIRLVHNGSIGKKTILLWDEPEANLNPSLARSVVSFLRAAAEMGIQSIIATHDTLISQRISLLAEYGEGSSVPTRFIGLYRTDDGVINADAGPVLADLQHNSLLDEFTRFSGEQRNAFEASLERGDTND